MLAASALAAALAAFTPVVVHDAAERSPLASAAASAPVSRDAASRAPAAYGRAVPDGHGGAWLQYWLYYALPGPGSRDRPHRPPRRATGSSSSTGSPPPGAGLEAVYAQHSGAERCGFGAVSLRGGRPVVFAAHGSHASYLQAGTRDRMWPDPNDEADGRGLVVAPAAGGDHGATARPGCATRSPGAPLAPTGSSRPSRTRLSAPRSRRTAGTPWAFAASARLLPGRVQHGRRVRRPREGTDLHRGPALLLACSPRSAPTGRDRPAAQAAAGWASGWCQGVRMRGPAAVIAIVNSKWAASEPSWE